MGLDYCSGLCRPLGGGKIRGRALAPQRGVPPTAIVDPLDIGEGFRPDVLNIELRRALQRLAFQRHDETLHPCVVVGIGVATDARTDISLEQRLAVSLDSPAGGDDRNDESSGLVVAWVSTLDPEFRSLVRFSYAPSLINPRFSGAKRP